MIRTAGLALAATLVFAVPAHASEWRQLADTKVGRLSIDTTSVHMDGPKTRFQYRIDTKTPQKNPATGKTYRSTVIDMTVSCAEKSGAMTQLLAFSEPEGKGALVDRVSLHGAPQTIVAGSSDDMLMKVACTAK